MLQKDLDTPNSVIPNNSNSNIILSISSNISSLNYGISSNSNAGLIFMIIDTRITLRLFLYFSLKSLVKLKEKDEVSTIQEYISFLSDIYSHA